MLSCVEIIIYSAKKETQSVFELHFQYQNFLNHKQYAHRFKACSNPRLMIGKSHFCVNLGTICSK